MKNEIPMMSKKERAAFERGAAEGKKQGFAKCMEENGFIQGIKGGPFSADMAYRIGCKDSNRVQLNYVPETTYGVAPGRTGPMQLNINERPLTSHRVDTEIALAKARLEVERLTARLALEQQSAEINARLVASGAR